MKANSLIAVLALFAFTPLSAPAAEQPVEVQVVDALNKLWGEHPGFRANHAKGVVAEGSFAATPAAGKLSKATLFSGKPIPVTVRFSDSTGLPTVADGSTTAVPHGMSLKFHLPDGSDTDMVLNALQFFPVATGAEFRDLLLAVAASPADAPKPTPLDAFVASHPSVPAANATAATPASFAEQEYHGIDAFVFVDAAGKRQAVRYDMVPEQIVHLSPDKAATMPPNFLIDELPGRLQRGPAVFHLKAQLAEPGDPTADPSKPWPADRKLVDLGTVSIVSVVPDSAGAQKSLLFLPGQLTDGIEESDDPLIDVRNGAYAESFARRNP